MQPEKQLLSNELSSELLEAQEKLFQLRAKLGIFPSREVDTLLEAVPQGVEVSWSLRNAQVALQQKRLQSGIAMPVLTKATPYWPEEVEEPSGGQEVTTPSPTTITVHPTIAMAILRQHLEAPARVYFLLRLIDSAGRGWVSVDQIRQRLTQKDAPLKICGWRRLRQLLAEGERVFWHRDEQDRLWLNGAHKIAYKLDSGRLQGFPIELPVQALLGGIQAVRAAFYASFHSGRDSKPISLYLTT